MRESSPQPSARRRFIARAAACLLLAESLFSCSGESAKSSLERAAGPGPNAAPILVVGVDGLEWDVLLPLLRAGRLPHLAGLMERGTHGLLETTSPTLSPVIWTTIATGKSPGKHGIGSFTYVDAQGRQRLHTNADRKTKAIWDILSDYGKRVAVIGWWMTYPVEPVNGVMVAQTNTLAQLDVTHGRNVWKGTLVRDLPAQVWPPEQQEPVMASLRESRRPPAVAH